MSGMFDEAEYGWGKTWLAVLGVIAAFFTIAFLGAAFVGFVF